MTVDDFLAQDERKDMLRLLTAGSVDDGKSTLIGRLLFDSKRIYDDQLQALERDSRQVGNAGSEIDYALLCDGLKAEREQGITIDVAYRYFATSRRKFIIADTPGHEQYTRNMITGGSTANLAIILVDARHGVVNQTRRHSYIVSLLGIKHIVLAVNKMDIVGYSEEVFESVVNSYIEWLINQEFEFPDLRCIPISALCGDNIVNRSQNMEWYTGDTLLQTLESVPIDSDYSFDSFRFPVQYVIRPNLDFRGFAGKIASGVVHIGDSVTALPSGKKSRIKQIITYDSSPEYAFAPQSVTLTLTDEIDLSRGQMLVLSDSKQPTVAHHITAMVVWMDEVPLDLNKSFYIKHTTSTVRAQFKNIEYRVDINTSDHIEAHTLSLNQIARVDIVCFTPLICDSYADNRQTGSFIVIDPVTNFTSAVGMIVEATADGTKEQDVCTISLSKCGIAVEHHKAIDRFCEEIKSKIGITINCID